MRHGVSNSDDYGYNESHDLAIPLVDSDRAEIVYPISPVTGLPTGDLHKALDLSLTEQERASVLAQLKSIGTDYVSADLSDDDLFRLVPSRLVITDDVDRRLWSRYVHQTLLPELEEQDKSKE